MKITRIQVKNVGPIGELDLAIDKPLLIFYGEIRQGKTTILNAIRWACGLAWPEDIIKHGAKEASIELSMDGGVISRSWYRAKEGDTKARPVQFVRNGKPVDNPTYELKRLLNPFVQDQDFLRKKTEQERKKYFAEFFAVDTAAIDSEMFNTSKAAESLRSKLTGYGEIDLTEIKPADESALQTELKSLRDAQQIKISAAKKQKDALLAEHATAVSAVRGQNADISRTKSIRHEIELSIKEAKGEIEELTARIEYLKDKIKRDNARLEEFPDKDLVQEPTAPDTSALDTVIMSQADTSEIEKAIVAAAAQNVRVEQYQKNLERAKARDTDEANLKALEEKGRELKKKKIALLAKTVETCGVPGLTFDETGAFTYEGVDGAMISTSQMMKLSSAISSLYPEGLSLELVDRGESLGKSIFAYVDYAKEKNCTVLATVVGEKPAQVPENVGVFVVKDGVVIKD